MPAIIPDDWDGTTFECKRIFWPSSKDWAAILLGQLTEPTDEKYWDTETGDQVAASFAVQTAYRQTIPDVYNLECDDLSNLPISAFKVHLTAEQAVPITTWTKVDFDVFSYEKNDPGYVLGSEAHSPIAEGKEGIWHYDVSLQVKVDPGDWFARSIVNSSGNILANSQSSGLFLDLSFDHNWDGAQSTLQIEAWVPSAQTLANTIGNTWWNGHYVGPVVLP